MLSGQDKDNVKSFHKLSAVLDQTSDEEFQLMSRAEADDCFKVYDMRLGGAPRTTKSQPWPSFPQ